jgi:hypothetical protein
MNHRGILALVAVMIASDPAAVLAGEDVERELLDLRGQSYVESIDMLFNVRSGGSLSLGTVLGSVRVRTWSREQIRLVVTKRTQAADMETARRILDGFSVRALHGGRDLALEGLARTRSAARAMGVEFTLWVPKSYNLEIRTRSGSIALPKVDGKFSAHTDAGTIVLDCDTDEMEIEVEDRSAPPAVVGDTGGQALHRTH